VVNNVDPDGRCFGFLGGIDTAFCGYAIAAIIGAGIGLGVGSELVNQGFYLGSQHNDLRWDDTDDLLRAVASGAIAGIGTSMVFAAGAYYTGATVITAGAFWAYNQWDSGGANSYNLLGILTGFDFIQADWQNFLEAETSNQRLRSFGFAGFNFSLSAFGTQGLLKSFSGIPRSTIQAMKGSNYGGH